jgi:hypothetical protein
MSNPTYKRVTELRRAAETIGRAFQKNAFNLYTTKHQTLEENINDFETRLIQLATTADAHIVQSDDQLSSVAVWIPPSHPTPAFPEPLIPEFREAEDEYARLLEKHLKGRPHWHLTILAKDPLLSDVKSSTSSVVRPFLEMTKLDNVPAMLECIDERAKAIYEHYGFKVVEEFTIAVGKSDAQGNPDTNGEGLKAWYMLYNN